MTHPLTPREKVVFKQPCEHCQRMTTVDHTALASGSGDHAELARLADDLRKFEHHSVGSLKISMDEVRRIIAACDAHAALLAEIAALRADRDRIAEELHGEINYAAEQSVNALEAESKLAEAVEDKDDLKERLSFATQLLRDYVDLTGGGHDVSALSSETRGFLSKEAERDRV